MVVIIALINNIYVFVEDEELNRDTTITQHPVEKGLPLTDIVRSEPKSISISGKIVDVGDLLASQIIAKLESLRTSGSLINYSGRNVGSNFQIKSFNTSHPNTNWGGADFDMELVEVRIAKSAYVPTSKKTNTSSNSTSEFKVGAIVVFKGGSVYRSSDAKTVAATRQRSTCKVTKINTKSWALHQYHLISTDGKKVYGWVDKSNIEGTGTSGTNAETNGGTQQVKTSTSKTTNSTSSTTKASASTSNKSTITILSRSKFNSHKKRGDQPATIRKYTTYDEYFIAMGEKYSLFLNEVEFNFEKRNGAMIGTNKNTELDPYHNYKEYLLAMENKYSGKTVEIKTSPF